MGERERERRENEYENESIPFPLWSAPIFGSAAKYLICNGSFTYSSLLSAVLMPLTPKPWCLIVFGFWLEVNYRKLCLL